MPSPRGTDGEGLLLSGPVSMAYNCVDGLGDYARSGAFFGAGLDRGAAFARDQTDLIPTGRPGSRAAEEPDQRYPTGPGRDQEPDEGIAKVKLFLRNRLSPEDFQRLETMLAALSGGGEEDDGGYDPDADPDAQRSPEGGSIRRSGQDQPPPFRGMPRPGGPKFGQDARSGSSYFDAYPSNRAVNVSDYGGR